MIKRYFLITFVFFAVFFTILTSQAKAAEVRITDLENLDGGVWIGSTSDINIEDDICIYSDSGSYTVTASGNGVGNDFKVENGPESFNYTLRWNDQAGTTAGQEQLTKDTPSTTQITTETTNSDCTNGTNLTARIQVRFSYSDLAGSLHGTYSGTLTLLIDPV